MILGQAALSAQSLRPEGANSKRPSNQDGALSEFSEQRLLGLAWTREQLDLDVDGAILAYEALLRRKAATTRQRSRALLRLFAIHRNRGRLDRLAALLRELLKPTDLPQLPPAIRVRVASVLKLIKLQGTQIRRAFESTHNAFRKRRSAAKSAHADASERAALRAEFLKQLNAAMRAIRKELRPDPRGDQAPARLFTALGARQQRDKTWDQRETRLRRILLTTPKRLAALEESHKRGSPEWKELDAQRRIAIVQYGKLFEHRKLRRQIEQFEKLGRYEEADRLVSKAEALERTIRPRRTNWNKIRTLRDPVQRRAALRILVDRFPEFRRRLRSSGGDAWLPIVEELKAKLKPLMRQKRWRDAGRVAGAYIEDYLWLRRLANRR